MKRVTEPLRDEHRDLWPHVEALAGAADAIGEAPVPTVLAGVEAAHDFLANHLIPHAEAEEQALYPTVGKLLGATAATATMSRDHVEVGRLTAELGQLRSRIGARIGLEALEPADARDLRRVLYGLSALVRLHFAKEEEIYLPLLDSGLTAPQAQQMFGAMEAAAASAKARRSTP